MTLIITLIYILTAVFWLVLTAITGHSSSDAGLYFQLLLFIIPFLGALVGFANAKKWGGFSSALGKATNFIAAGTFFWSVGMLIWNYYIFISKVEVPYPSLADASFILSWPLWAIGVIYLSKATGVKFALRSLMGKISLFVIPFIAIIGSYYTLVVVARGGVLELDGSSGWKLFFDLFYPIGTAVIMAIALTFFALSVNFLGGKYKVPIIVLVLAFIVNYLADFTFSLTTTYETYFNGHFVDFLFVTGMFLFALSLSLLRPASDISYSKVNP